MANSGTQVDSKKRDSDRALLVKAVVELFNRERPRYEKLLELVVADVQELLADKQELARVLTIQARVKGIESLRNKINIRVADSQSSHQHTGVPLQRSDLDGAIYDGLEVLAQVEAGRVAGQDEFSAEGDTRVDVDLARTAIARRILDAVPDLVGIRLLPYDRKSLDDLNSALVAYWSRDNSDSPFSGQDSQQDHGVYHATHFRVTYAPHYSGDSWWLQRKESSRVFLKGVTCEVQTTWMLQHVINEVNHTFYYKPELKKALEGQALGSTDAHFDYLKSDLDRAQKSIETMMEVLVESTPQSDSQDDEREDFTNVAATEGTFAASQSETGTADTPTRTRGKNTRELIQEGNLIADGEVLTFHAPSPDEQKRVKAWAKEFAARSSIDPQRLLSATWESDRGRLRWSYDPSIARYASALTQEILHRACGKPLRGPRSEVRGPAYWQNADGRSMAELAEEAVAQAEASSAVAE